jgi:hypothetical protein
MPRTSRSRPRCYREGGDKAGAKFTELAADFAAAIRGMPKEDLLSREVRQQRRALALATTAALLVLAIGAATAGIVAYRAQQEAVAQRNRAEQTLAAATETTNVLVFDLAQGLRNVSGVPSAMVKAILDRARALQVQWARYLGAHCHRHAEHDGWQRDLSLAYNRVGEILHKQNDLSGALKSFQASLASGKISPRPTATTHAGSSTCSTAW